jgi:hypothetical protein
VDGYGWRGCPRRPCPGYELIAPEGGVLLTGRVAQVRSGDGTEISISPGSYIAPAKTPPGWVVYTETAFFDRYEALPIEMPVHPDGEVVG